MSKQIAADKNIPIEEATSKQIVVNKNIPLVEGIEELQRARENLLGQVAKLKEKNSEMGKQLRAKDKEIAELLEKNKEIEGVVARGVGLQAAGEYVDVIAVPMYSNGRFIKPAQIKDGSVTVPFSVDEDQCYCYRLRKEQAAALCCANPARYVFTGPEDVRTLYATTRVNGAIMVRHVNRRRKVKENGVISFVEA
jgi:hypothetical protein